MAGSLSLNQSQYIKGVLSCFGMADCTLISAPLPTRKHYKAMTPDDHAKVSSYLYLEAISSLIYAAMGTQPDISAAVQLLSPFAAMFGQEHINGIKSIMCYLAGLLNHRIMYTMGGGGLIGYTDTDWANDTSNHCSISGYAFLYSGGAVSWMSKQQSTTALSSTHAKYVMSVLPKQNRLRETQKQAQPTGCPLSHWCPKKL